MGRGALVDDDVGMSDASEGSKRRGRQAARKSGPMGERVSTNCLFLSSLCSVSSFGGTILWR